MHNLSIGNIGVITTIENFRMFKIDTISNGLIYCRSIDGPLIFTQCIPDNFWALLDNLE